MLARRRATLSLTFVFMVAGLAPATGAEALPPEAREAIGPAALARLQEHEALADRLRQAMSDGRIADAMAGALGTTAPEPPTGPGGLPGTPLDAPGLAEPIGALLAAVERARDLVGAEWSGTPREYAELLGGALERMSRPTGPVVKVRPPAGVADELSIGGPIASGDGWPTGEAISVEGPVPTGDEKRILTAADRAGLLIAAAIDRHLPSLRIAAGPGTGEVVEGCDIHEELPLLCVGSEANNVYEDDVALLIDLGGGDVYHNNAGGAPFGPDVTDDLHRVAVAVDLGGNDRYEEPPSFPMQFSPDGGTTWFTHRIAAAQGGALPGSVGFLLDEDGDDTYSAHMSSEEDEPYAFLVAQGGGGGAFATGLGTAGQPIRTGASGTLIDLAGNDRYEMTAEEGSDRRLLTGQGGAAFGGAGLLADAGGDDDYRVDGGRGLFRPGDQLFFDRAERILTVQGASLNQAVGVLVDTGGADGFEARAEASAPQRDAFTEEITRHIPGTLNYAQNMTAQTATAIVDAQGMSAGGASLALLVEGPGPTTYTAETTGDGMALAYTAGQGHAWAAAAGALVDQGGDDVYSLRATTTYDRTITVDDSCGCQRAERFISAASNTPGSAIVGQGHGDFHAFGVLSDHAGNDVYEAVGESRIDITLEDRLSAPGAPPSLGVYGFTPAYVMAQGAQSGGLVGPSGGPATTAGLLVDAAGTDSYRWESSNTVRAGATSENAQGEPRVGALASWRTFTHGQGGTWADATPVTAALLDLGGLGGRIVARAVNRAETWPDPQGAYAIPWNRPSVQGATGGHLVDLGGAAPTILSSPSMPAVTGERGYGYWDNGRKNAFDIARSQDPHHQLYDRYDVGGHGAGLAPLAAGRAPQLAFVEEGPLTVEGPFPTVGQVEGYAAAPRFPVTVSVRDADGEPIAGAEIHLALQLEVVVNINPLVAPLIGSLYEETVVTGPDGTATASLLATDASEEYAPRVLATYDGRGGEDPLYAAHTALDVDFLP